MEVTCIADSARHLPANTAAYNPEAVLHVAAGVRYRVAGMSLYAGALMLLILDDTQLPNWYPIQLFEVEENGLPNNWLFAAYSDSEHLQAIWGYDELIREESHYDALLERNLDALRIFAERSQQSG